MEDPDCTIIRARAESNSAETRSRWKTLNYLLKKKNRDAPEFESCPTTHWLLYNISKPRNFPNQAIARSQNASLFIVVYS
jgi:hypothetical protein